MIFHTNQQLESGKSVLVSKGYTATIGAKHIDVVIDKPMTNKEIESLQKELTAIAGAEVWVMALQRG